MNKHINQETDRPQTVDSNWVLIGAFGFAFSLFALFMSILALIASFTGATILTPVFISVFAVLALVFVRIARKNGCRTKLSTLGKVFGIISAVICGIAAIIAFLMMLFYW